MTRRRLNLAEDVLRLPPTPLEVDEATGIVRGVKVLGWESRNGRRYLREAVTRKLHLYEDRVVNIDHPTTNGESRSFASRFGRLRGPRVCEDGVRADLHYNPKHPQADSFAWWAKNDPQAIGLSHNAVGEVEEAEDGTLTVTDILEVHSVDLVADPATTNGLREDHVMDPLDALDDMGGETAAEPKPGDEHYAEHIGKAVVAILGDEAMDAEEKKKKILHLLKLDEVGTEQPGVGDEEPLEEEDDEEGDEEDGKKKPPAESMESVRAENRRLKAELDAYRLVERRGKARKKCQCLGLSEAECSDVFIDGILSATSRDQIVRLVEDRKAILGRASTPRSSGPDYRPAPANKAPVAQPADKVAATLNGAV